MNKTLIAMAMAGVVAAPMAAQAEISVYGDIMLMYNTYGAANVGDQVTSDDSIIGITGSSTTDSGNTVYAAIRIDGGLTDDGGTFDGVKMGIKGDFGNVCLGECGHPVDYGQLANDIQGLSDEDFPSINYLNTIGDISFIVGISPEGNADSPATNNGDATGIGVKWSSGDYTVGYGSVSAGKTPAVGLEDANALGASASFGDIGVDFHTGEKGTNDVTAFRVRWSGGAMSAAFTSSTQSPQGGGADTDATQVDLAYSLGGGATIKVRSKDTGAANNVGDFTRIGLHYAF